MRRSLKAWLERWNAQRTRGRRQIGDQQSPLTTDDDGSYLSGLYPSDHDRKQRVNGIVVRVIEYTLTNVPDSEPMYRLLTTLLDDKKAPALTLATLYHERWEVELVFDELKTHQVQRCRVLRSKTPELVQQEF